MASHQLKQSGYGTSSCFTPGMVETLKIILLGKANIGKTALTRRFIRGDFSDTDSTVRVECMQAHCHALLFFTFYLHYSDSWIRMLLAFTSR